MGCQWYSVECSSHTHSPDSESSEPTSAQGFTLADGLGVGVDSMEHADGGDGHEVESIADVGAEWH